MGIRQIDGGQSFLTPQKKIKEEEAAQGDFQKFLQKAHSNLQGSSPANVPATAPGSEEISSHFLAAISPMNQPKEVPGNWNPLSARTESAKAVEETLDLLDRYCKAMESPGLSLKEIDPLLKTLTEKIDGLSRWSERLPLGDPLQKIVSEASILSRVEIEKFNRGDYL